MNEGGTSATQQHPGGSPTGSGIGDLTEAAEIEVVGERVDRLSEVVAAADVVKWKEMGTAHCHCETGPM